MFVGYVSATPSSASFHPCMHRCTAMLTPPFIIRRRSFFTSVHETHGDAPSFVSIFANLQHAASSLPSLLAPYILYFLILLPQQLFQITGRRWRWRGHW
jgi:hypothetical protein